MDLVTGLMQTVGKKTLNKMKNTVTGGVEHAILSIYSKKDREVTEEEDSPTDLGGQLSKFKSDITGKIKDFATKNAPNLTNMVSSMLGGPDMGEDIRNYEVQFNPETINFQASLEENESLMSTEENKNQMEFGSADAKVIMSMKLMFDESRTASRIVPQNNVQKQVEGLMSAISDECTRFVVFTWGNMSYEGYLNSIEAKYTMYDTTGRPMRAEMNLSIRLYGASQLRSTSPDRPLGYWQSEYDALISKLSKTGGQENGGLFQFNK